MTLEEEIQELDGKFSELIRKSPKTPSEMEEMERIRQALEAALRQHEKPLMDDLANVGIHAEVWDLVNTSASYPEAILILIKHLSWPYHRDIKEGIVRALAVKEAKGIANKAIMDEYLRTPKEDSDHPWIYHFKWAFGNTMTVIVTENDLDDLIRIVLDESNGTSRDGFVEALAKLKSPKVMEVLSQLVNDKSKLVAQAAQKALDKKTRALERKAKSR